MKYFYELSDIEPVGNGYYSFKITISSKYELDAESKILYVDDYTGQSCWLGLHDSVDYPTNKIKNKIFLCNENTHGCAESIKTLKTLYSDGFLTDQQKLKFIKFYATTRAKSLVRHYSKLNFK